MQPWHAELSLTFACQGHKTVLASNQHSGPLRVQKALYPELPTICHVVMVHPPAGIAGGDTLKISLALQENTHAVLSTPGATQWYKSTQAAPASMAAAITLEAGARLDWLPQENILFDRSHAVLNTLIDAHPSASAIGWDVCMLGRRAGGETWRQASLAQDTQLLRGGKPLWIEHSQVSSEQALRSNAAALAGHAVVGTLWAVGERANSEVAQAFAATLPYHVALKAGVTFLQDNHHTGGAIVLRVLGDDMQAVRACLVKAWMHLRPIIHGVDAVPLRLWAM
jgi:urease accessory protein